MKFYFSLFFIFILAQNAHAEKMGSQYLVKTKGIKIGELNWNIDITEDTYKVEISLKSKGILSKIYRFEGEYFSSGIVYKKSLIPKKYKQVWTTNKKKREVIIKFNNLKIIDLINLPQEKEVLRISLVELDGYKDPLTSFLSILLYKKPSKTVDGRRIYLLNPKVKKGKTKILVEEYHNLWADHKRNSLDYIEFFEDEKSVLPKKINISFEGSIFSILKN